MAKQSGIHQLRGKYGNNVYYTQKGVAGGLVRKINEGMSNRVKNDAAFANTRRNAAEFGAAGNFAGASVRSISQRWRTILDPFATGKLGKDMLPLIKADATGEWGQRGLSGTTWQDIFRQKLAGYAKNQYSENFAVGLTAKYDTESLSVEGTTTAQTSEGLLARGAEGVVYEFYLYTSEFGVFSEAAEKYQSSVSSIDLMGSVDAEIGAVTSLAVSKTFTSGYYTDADTRATAVLVVAKPYKVVNNVKYTLQELCSFDLIKIAQV